MWRKIQAILAAILLLALWTWWSNENPMLHKIVVRSEDVPEAFSGYRIAQVSDLHDAEFGEGHEKLLKLLKKSKADILVLTGDIVDAHRTDIEQSLSFVRQAAELLPVYYVPGNHEASISKRGEGYEIFKQGLQDCGVTLLEDDKTRLEKDGQYLTLIGLRDVGFHPLPAVEDQLLKHSLACGEQLAPLTEEDDGYRILLSHRPELFAVYAGMDIDLTFSGHVHGGQFRLPFVGGLYGPGQGVFPQYDSGLYQQGDSQMIVSRGLGNSTFPVRFNNRPELIVAELKAID